MMLMTSAGYDPFPLLVAWLAQYISSKDPDSTQYFNIYDMTLSSVKVDSAQFLSLRCKYEHQLQLKANRVRLVPSPRRIGRGRVKDSQPINMENAVFMYTRLVNDRSIAGTCFRCFVCGGNLRTPLQGSPVYRQGFQYIFRIGRVPRIYPVQTGFLVYIPYRQGFQYISRIGRVSSWTFCFHFYTKGCL